jgi:hypothetical protein
MISREDARSLLFVVMLVAIWIKRALLFVAVVAAAHH